MIKMARWAMEPCCWTASVRDCSEEMLGLKDGKVRHHDDAQELRAVWGAALSASA